MNDERYKELHKLWETSDEMYGSTLLLELISGIEERLDASRSYVAVLEERLKVARRVKWLRERIEAIAKLDSLGIGEDASTMRMELNHLLAETGGKT